MLLADVEGKRCFDRINEFGGLERFFKKIDRTSLHCIHTHGDVAMCGHENDRKVIASHFEFLLEFDAIDSRQPNVKKQASRVCLRGGVEKVGRTLKALGIHVQRLEEIEKGKTKLFVVLDDVDNLSKNSVWFGNIGSLCHIGSSNRNRWRQFNRYFITDPSLNK